MTSAQGVTLHRDRWDFAMTEPNSPYLTRSEGPIVGMLWVFLAPTQAMLSLMDWPMDAPGFRRIRVTDRTMWNKLYRAMQDVGEQLVSVHPEREALALNAVERLLLLARPVVRAARSLPTGGSGGQAFDARIERALALIHDRPAHAWTLRELARSVAMSESSLTHRFKQCVGMSPMRYASLRRIERAKSLLLGTDDPIAHIGDQLGYANAFHFSSSFRAATGKSPRAFRLNPA